jgi:hypothetical protein
MFAGLAGSAQKKSGSRQKEKFPAHPCGGCGMAEGHRRDLIREAAGKRQMKPASRPLLLYLSIGTIWVLQAVIARSEAIGNGIDLAKAIIERAKSNGTVDLTWLGDKTCFVPESIYAPFFAKEWFAGYDVKYDHNVDKSNRFWYIIASNDNERIARIYSIDQTILRWNVPEEVKVRDAVGCKSTVRVLIPGEPAEIIIFQW